MRSSKSRLWFPVIKFVRNAKSDKGKAFQVYRLDWSGAPGKMFVSCPDREFGLVGPLLDEVRRVARLACFEWEQHRPGLPRRIKEDLCLVPARALVKTSFELLADACLVPDTCGFSRDKEGLADELENLFWMAQDDQARKLASWQSYERSSNMTSDVMEVKDEKVEAEWLARHLSEKTETCWTPTGTLPNKINQRGRIHELSELDWITGEAESTLLVLVCDGKFQVLSSDDEMENLSGDLPKESSLLELLIVEIIEKLVKIKGWGIKNGAMTEEVLLRNAFEKEKVAQSWCFCHHDKATGDVLSTINVAKLQDGGFLLKPMGDWEMRLDHFPPSIRDVERFILNKVKPGFEFGDKVVVAVEKHFLSGYETMEYRERNGTEVFDMDKHDFLHEYKFPVEDLD